LSIWFTPGSKLLQKLAYVAPTAAVKGAFRHQTLPKDEYIAFDAKKLIYEQMVNGTKAAGLALSGRFALLLSHVFRQAGAAR
jgi:hypothetical protein